MKRKVKTMIITIFGCRPYEFKDEATNRDVSGMSLFYAAKTNDTSVKGQISGKLNIRRDSPVYYELFNHDYTEPLQADAIFDLNPSTGKAVLSDFRLLSGAYAM